MKTLKIEGTKYSPMVRFNEEGEMSISGRSIMEDPMEFYRPIIQIIKECQTKKFTLEIRLEYMNTSSTKVLLDLMLTVKECYNSTDVFINWFYESDDDDMLETGKDFESIIRIPIDFYEMCES